MPILSIDDFSLHYVEAGSGPPLLIVHGLGGSWQDWEAQIAHLSQRYRVIAPDLRGFGASTRGWRLGGIARLAADLRALLQALQIEQFVLIGHSMGGAVSLQLALEEGPRVQRLVIANSVPSFRPETLRHYAEFVYRWLAMGLLGPARLARISAARTYPRPEQAALRAQSIARGARNRRFSYLSALAALGRWSVQSRLHELELPVLLLGSEHDYFTREETLRFAQALPQAQLHIVPEAHHSLPSEYPQLVNDYLDRFLAGAEQREAAQA
ncbi:Pimeloyl-ACP methyl ester carboxylesterase [Solimonas aquatica]|uniref:Pimeloyl-ACP methyl ester carboxylesterase n=1 Tax=Solimonas aquatica TaxID=489703 RepID=A0A1H9DGZ5_9GAMM|nr:alpha/beta hydrolase [Solimonas aquatica]SEQ12018.1 Pimeloyl-ACP methyl ester carboxylesterase [Solimonas aquatica]